jgi:APA family basic amino acid/polyamine antiporter
MSGRPEVSSELSRDLSLFHITMMGLGMMIGAGVFLGTGKSIGYAGPGGVLLTFALNGVIAIFTAMSYAELSSAIPHAGGAYNFARIGFGRGTSFIAGWMEWFASSVAGALYAVCFATYTVRFVTGLEFVTLSPFQEGLAVKVVAVLIGSLFVYINYCGASETGKIGAIMTLAQTLFLLVIGAIGIVVVVRDPARLSNFTPFLNPAHGRWASLLVTMGFTAVAFEGYEVIAQAGDETVNPRQNIPKAMLFSVLIVTFTYVACAFATVVAVKAGPGLLVDGVAVSPWEWIGAHGAEGFGAAVERLMPRWGGLLVVLAVIFASTSALNATIYSATRAAYALGRDRMLPPVFASISKTRKTPWVALVGTGGIVLLVASCLDAEGVAASASIMFLFLFFLVNICVIRIRYNMGDELEYGFLMPFFPLLPVLAIISQAILAVFLHEMGAIAWIIAPLWVGAGLLIYQFYSKSRAIATPDEIHVLEEEHTEVIGGYRVMVAVANPDNALALVRNTYVMCGAKNAQVQLLHMVPVPGQVPLSDADKYMMAGKEAICEAMLYLAPLFPVSSTFRYCRNAARGIVSAVREKQADLLILGWHGKRKSRRFALGSTIDPVIERVPCNVVIMKQCGGDRNFRHALVPVAGGGNSGFALEVASILAGDGNVTVFTVDTGRETGGFDVESLVDERLAQITESRVSVKTKTVHDKHVVSAILEEAENEDEDYDIVVLGCTGQPVWRQVASQSVPETVAQMCAKPVVMVKAAGGITSWIKRWV